MFCPKCGKQIQDGAKFCPHCGAMTSAASAENSAPKAPVYTMPTAGFNGANGTAQWSDPASGGKKRRGGGLIIGGAVALVLVVVLLVAAISGLFASPKGQVEKALAKTASAYADAKAKMGAPDLSELMKSKSYSQRVSVELDSVNQELMGWYNMPSLKGAGVRMNADYDQKGRKMDFDMAVIWDGEDLASLQMLIDNDTITFASPEFTKGNAYGFNTKTLGADLYKLGVEDDDVDVKKIGFNFFDLLEKATPSDDQTKEMEKALSDARKALLDAIEVDKGSKQSVQVNGKSMDATLYNVVVPKDAMKDYVSAMTDAMKTVDSQDMMKEMLQSMGFDKATVNEIMSEVNTTDVYGQMGSVLKDAVKAIGDVELEVYVSGGYVVKVEYSGRVQGSKLEIELQLGGGDNYVDNLSLEISANGQKVTLESNGDHAGKSGVFTDETVIRIGSDRITSELRYEPKASKNNFEWELRVNSTASLSMEGQLTTAKDSIDLHLDDLSVKAAGTKVVSLEADYYLGPCKGMTVSHSSPKMLLDMSEDDLMDELEENAEDWAYDLADRFPALYNMF